MAERLEQMGIAKGIEIGRSEGRTEEKLKAKIEGKIEGKTEGKILVYRNLAGKGLMRKKPGDSGSCREDVSLEH